LLACFAEWLAGKACCNHIDKSRVFFSGTGLDELVNVSKDWGCIEAAVFDPLGDDLLTVFFVFDITDMAPS
tara:strand:+ start:520 stop:732 length:213 start_codon:yes stop_codon:yes gene_type:complete